jgi:hypothetical protein
MTVINTSPAIHLHAVLPGGLASLAKLIGEVIVPWEVGQELDAGHAKDATWQKIQLLPGILHRLPQSTPHRANPPSVAQHPLRRFYLSIITSIGVWTGIARAVATVL